MPRPSHLSIELLQTFVLLLHNEGDASRTADQLGINQPSISKRLKFLQHAGAVVNRPWIQREGRTWVLTAEGERVRPAVEEIVNRYDQLSRFVNASVEAHVRFACGQTAVQTYVRQALLKFRKSQPAVRLQVSTMRGQARIEGVANGWLDLATVTHDESEITELARRDLYVQDLFEDAFVIACDAQSPWAQAIEKLPKTKAPPDALREFPLILPDTEAGVRHALDRVLRTEGIFQDLNIVLETGGWSTILQYVRDGVGVGVLSERAIVQSEQVLARRLDPTRVPPRICKLICRRAGGSGEELDLSPPAKVFREILLSAAQSTSRHSLRSRD